MKLTKRVSFLSLSLLMTGTILVGCDQTDWQTELENSVKRITISNHTQLENNVEVVTEVNVRGVNVPITWEVVEGVGHVEFKNSVKKVKNEEVVYKKLAITPGETPTSYSVKAKISHKGKTAEKTLSGYVVASDWKVVDTVDHGKNSDGIEILSVNQMKVKPVDTDDYYQVEGIIEEVDQVNYGKIWIRDVNYDASTDADGSILEASKIYISGLRQFKGQSLTEYKTFFSTLGIDVGDKVTVIGTRGESGHPQIAAAYYVSHSFKQWTIDEVKESIPNVLNSVFKDEEAVSGQTNTYTASTMVNLSLPTSKKFGNDSNAKNATISWTSSDPTVISNTGEIQLSAGTLDKDVTLTATVAIAGESDTQTYTYNLKVSALPEVSTIDSVLEVMATTFEQKDFDYYLVDVIVAGHDNSGRPIVKDATTGKAIILYSTYDSVKNAEVGTRMKIYAQAVTHSKGFPELTNPKVISTTEPTGTFSHGAPKATMTADEYCAAVIESGKAYSSEYIEITGCKAVKSGNFLNIETANGVTIQANINETSAAAAKKVFEDSISSGKLITVRGYGYGSNSSNVARIFVMDAEVEA